jgi:hypothetical protein
MMMQMGQMEEDGGRSMFINGFNASLEHLRRVAVRVGSIRLDSQAIIRPFS